MGIFGGEKYSKENILEAKRDRDTSTEGFIALGGSEKGSPLTEVVKGILHIKTGRAMERIEKLHEKGKAEAIALNEEYNRLVAQAQEAVTAIEDFEKDKLGMSKGD